MTSPVGPWNCVSSCLQRSSSAILRVCFLFRSKSEDDVPAEMFDNPLYGSMSSRSKDSEAPQRKDHLSPPETMFTFPKAPEGGAESERGPPVPTPRNRSYTYSDTKPQPTPSGGPCSAPPAPSAGLQPQSYTKKPVVPSRSEGGVAMAGRPPLPVKGQGPGPPQLPQIKPRDYRDSSELPNKLRGPSRPSPPIPKEGRKP